MATVTHYAYHVSLPIREPGNLMWLAGAALVINVFTLRFPAVPVIPLMRNCFDLFLSQIGENVRQWSV